MDTVFYRKICQLVLREVAEGFPPRDVAQRAIEAKNIKKSDRRILRHWMLAWCDHMNAGRWRPDASERREK